MKTPAATTSDNEDMNSNETESINELDELDNSEDMEIGENEDGNNSNMSDEDEETDEENYRNNKKLKVRVVLLKASLFCPEHFDNAYKLLIKPFQVFITSLPERSA